MVTYTFESTDEGFSLTGNGSLEYTFDNWTNPTTGLSDSYFFEYEPIIKFSVHESINAYSVMTLTESELEIQHLRNHQERRKLKETTFTDDTYSNLLFRGEIR